MTILLPKHHHTGEGTKFYPEQDLQAYGDARAAEALEQAALLCEAQRRKVLNNPGDPSWTEHFAELQNLIRKLKGTT